MDKRQWSRTQGRFSHDDNKPNRNNESRVVDDEDVKKNKRRASTKTKKSDKDVKRNSPPRLENPSKFQSGSGRNNAYEKGSLVYQEVTNDNSSFERENSPAVITIDKSGVHCLSETENGKSIVFYKHDFMAAADANHSLVTLSQEIEWYDKNIVIRGQEYPQPRLVAWFGPLPYKYSGVTLEAKEFPPLIVSIKKDVESALRHENMDVELNSVLLNLYRNGKDSVAWHSDDEISMGIRPTIASVSLGETRRFEMRRKPSEPNSPSPPQYVVHLKHGSLIVMDGAMQLDWQHRVPKEYHDRKERINLTFRTVYPIAKVPRPHLTDHKSYIPAPHPKPVSAPEPFELHGEEFPALGNSSSCSTSEHSKNAVDGENESPISKWGNQDIKSSLSSPHNPVGDSSKEWSNQEYEENVNFASEEKPTTYSNAYADVTSDAVWKSIPNTETPVTNQECEENSRKTRDIDFSSKEAVTSESAPGDPGIWGDVSNIKPFVPTYVPEEPRVSSFSTCSQGKHQNSERNCVINSGASTKCAIKEKLWFNYDYVFKNWDTKLFTWYEREELEVLMGIADHVDNLPNDVVTIVSDRIGLLISNANRRGHGERVYHNQGRSNRFQRNNGRNPNHRYYN